MYNVIIEVSNYLQLLYNLSIIFNVSLTDESETQMRILNEQEMRLQETFNKSVLNGATKSELFRQMYDSGISIGDISKVTESHYSFVYGVISSSRDIETKPTNSKSDEIRKLYDSNLTPGQIAKQLNSNYSFVFSVCKKYQQSKAK